MGLVFKRRWVAQLISEGSTEAQDRGEEGASENEEGASEDVQRWPGSTSAHIHIERRR